jgi:endonuclease/exonuclease/phosphatase family metal-dependent hydrolase
MINSLAVMTFNIRGNGEEKDGINHWSQRRQLNIQTIRRVNPDILGLQEVQYGNLAAYHNDTHNYHHYLGLNMNYGNFNPIFWKKDRFRLTNAGEFWLNPAQRRDKPAIEWGTHNIRSTTWVILEDMYSGKYICHINTHLDHISEQARVNGSKLILDRWHTIADGLPTLVTGDFNSGRWIPPELGFKVPYTDDTLKLYERAEFVDTYTLFHTDGFGSNTFHNFEGESYQPAHSYGLWRVDWILAQDLRATSCDIIRDAEPPLFPSDHYPVVAVVTY